ncbi:MAG: hypothetical protein ACKN9T_11555, partial [Candidatus Methylumidiphilus sp.]
MSSENPKDTPAAAGLVENLKSNPKALGIAAFAVALVLFLVVKGGGESGEKPAQVVAVNIGQKVTVYNPNTDEGNTILVAAPGAAGLAEGENEKDDSVVCRVVVKGTGATVEELSTVNYIPFAKVTLTDGACSG